MGPEIKSKYWHLLEELREWHRYFIFGLPGEFGKWMRARYLRRKCGACGVNPQVWPRVWITNPEKVRLGNNVAISAGTFITAGGGVSIGDHAAIGPDAKIWSVNHAFEDPDKPFLEQGWEYKEVIIERDVWIGAACFIKPGVVIGEGSIISAGSVLSKSIPPFAIVAGNPARVVGWRKKPDTAEQAGESAPAAFGSGGASG